MSIIFYGPQGCGKTKKSAEIAKHFGLHHVIDGWDPGDELPEDTLAITNVQNVPGAQDFTEVMAEITESRS